MQNSFDLAIIGAGIYGASLAYEASARGLSVVVIDQKDTGAATSANSLKVIHGGLRYLQSLDIPRSRYSASERRELLRYAPNLIKPLHCQVGLGRSLVKNELSVALVATFYNLLTRNRNVDMPLDRQIPDARLAKKDDLQRSLATPLKNPGDFVLDWHDAQAVDTERLLVTLLRDAQARGAHIFTYARVTGMQRQGQRWAVTLTEAETGECSEIFTRRVVDCSGAWSVCEKLLDKRGEKPLRYVKAVNLVLKKSLGDHAFGFTTAAEGRQRLLFAAPCEGHTLLGTWYFDEVDPDSAELSRSVAEQCLAEANSAFERETLSLDDISYVHVGYLPADRHDPALKDPESWLQKHNRVVSWEDVPDVWVIKGTKYTTARYEAERFLEKHPDWITSVRKQAPLPELLLGMDGPSGRYGRYSPDWQNYANRLGDWAWQPLRGTTSHYAGEVQYAVQKEWARHLDDILIRRLGLGNLQKPSKQTVAHCLEILQQTCGWDAAHCESEEQRLWACYPTWLKD